MREKSSARTLVIVLVSVLVLVGLIVLAYLYFVDQGTPNEIVLPNSQIVTPEPPQQTDPPAEGLAELNANNAKAVLQTLAVTSTYRQVLNVTEFWQDGSATRLIEVYVRSGVTKVIVQAAKKTQHYLTDGEKLFTWYAGDEDAAEVTLPEDTTVWELVSVADYVTALERTEILEASFLPADDTASDRIYVHCAEDSDVSYQFWIDIETALALHTDVLSGKTLIHQVQQKELEILMPGDSALQDVFLLPDGSDPFGS